jgi:predicted phage tail protein
MADDLVPYVAEPEIVGDQPAGFVRVLVLANVFTMERYERQVPEGQTLEQIVASLGLAAWKTAMVAIDGTESDPRYWKFTRPKSGHVVTVRAIPRGSGGSGDKGWIQIAAGVLLIIVGIVLAVGSYGSLSAFGVPLIVAGVGMVVGGALTLIFPPPSLPKLKAGSGSDAPVFSITGTRNQINPYGAMPRRIGR